MGPLDYPERPDSRLEDRKLALLLHFMCKARDLGVILSVANLEELLPAFDIPLFGDEHQILVLSYHEAMEAQGHAPSIEQLIADYPRWKWDIESNIKMRQLFKKYRPRGQDGKGR